MTNPVTYKHVTVFIPHDQGAITCRFDYPDIADNSFYFGIPVGFPGNPTALLQKVRPENAGPAVIVRESEQRGLPNGFKYFDISNYVPGFVRDRLGKDQDVPGPNCYQAALASLGVGDVEGRHVDPLEAGFYFSRYFEDVQGDPMLGDLRIYYKRQLAPARALSFAADEEPEPALIDIMEHAHDIPPSIGASCVHMFNLEETPDWIGTVIDAVPDISDESLDAVTAITAMAPVAEAEMLDSRALLEELDAELAETEAELEEVMERARAAGVEFAEAAEAAAEGIEEAPEIAAEYYPVIKPGVHAAVIVMGGFGEVDRELVFQRGGWDEDHVNMIVPAALAMSSIEPISRDPFDPAERAEDDDYVSHAIRMLSPAESVRREEAREIDEELSSRVEKYAGAIEHYTARLLAVSGFQWSEFANNRLDLLSMENLWTILDDVEKILGKKGGGLIRALQSIDEDVAKAYLKLRSLRWQYQVMVNRYDSPGRADSSTKKKRRLRELYKKHYINPDSKVFKKEIKAHLAMRDVDPKRWSAIIKRVIVQVKLTNPVNLLKPYGASQIDFFGILDRAISS